MCALWCCSLSSSFARCMAHSSVSSHAVQYRQTTHWRFSRSSTGMLSTMIKPFIAPPPSAAHGVGTARRDRECCGSRASCADDPTHRAIRNIGEAIRETRGAARQSCCTRRLRGTCTRARDRIGGDVFESRLYKKPILQRRCIIPVSGFFEWKKEGSAKRPFKIFLKE